MTKKAPIVLPNMTAFHLGSSAVCAKPTYVSRPHMGRVPAHDSIRETPWLLQVLRPPVPVAAAIVAALPAFVSLAVWDWPDDDLIVAQRRPDTARQGIRIAAKAQRWWR